LCTYYSLNTAHLLVIALTLLRSHKWCHKSPKSGNIRMLRTLQHIWC